MIRGRAPQSCTLIQKCAHLAYDLWDVLVTVCVVLLKFEELYYFLIISFFYHTPPPPTYLTAPIFKNRMELSMCIHLKDAELKKHASIALL